VSDTNPRFIVLIPIASNFRGWTSVVTGEQKYSLRRRKAISAVKSRGSSMSGQGQNTCFGAGLENALTSPMPTGVSMASRRSQRQRRSRGAFS
jgi:hypothetical protein